MKFSVDQLLYDKGAPVPLGQHLKVDDPEKLIHLKDLNDQSNPILRTTINYDDQSLSLDEWIISKIIDKNKFFKQAREKLNNVQLGAVQVRVQGLFNGCMNAPV